MGLAQHLRSIISEVASVFPAALAGDKLDSGTTITTFDGVATARDVLSPVGGEAEHVNKDVEPNPS